jgi:hypothetical protein
MGVIINLYAIRRPRLGESRDAGALALRLLEERLVVPPLTLGPAFSSGRLLNPGDVKTDRLLARLHREAGEKAGDPHPSVRTLSTSWWKKLPTLVRESEEPCAVEFQSLNPKHHVLAREFGYSQEGPTCDVTIYSFPKPYRLTLTFEGEKRLFDGAVQEWLHLSGKRAPWLSAYKGSPLDRAVRSCWPDVEVMEVDWM